MPAQRNIGLEELRQYFGLPAKEVAKSLGICLTSLKKVCRNNEINRWPYRKMKSLEKRTLQTAEVRGVMGASSPNEFRSIECSSPSSEISHASTVCSPSPSPECCTEHLLTQEIDPSGGTDASSDSNVAGLSDEELIAMLAGCAAPAGRQTRSHPHQSWTSGRMYLAAGPPPRQILDLDDEEAAAAIESEAAASCCSFLHLEGCVDALDSLQDEALVCQSHTLDDQDQHSTLWSQDSLLLGLL